MGKLLKTGWYVLYVRSRHERKVDDLLKENQLESFLPMITTIRRWSDRRKMIKLPLFPSYVFVKINSSMDFHKAVSIEGACTFIKFGNEYARVSEEEILKIKLCIGSDELSDIKTSGKLLRVGENKVINSGSLSGLECEILKINNANKIIVRINSLQQNIIASIPSYHLVSLGNIA
ncbi:UpxY family transcription antiterminator [Aquimarina gracilis]|uniref:UpxY family transcription antiterminator n=1 Tax=Aquimarina gracilis TaxID=874422 RepID=A0ABU5ZSG3_9FLAO|nr:UpxY family transcription antiterminator [Aquimarina gracilis]MEB3344968.1 UpxY family transcription antiterminator [Aquimarina gracilis]